MWPPGGIGPQNSYLGELLYPNRMTSTYLLILYHQLWDHLWKIIASVNQMPVTYCSVINHPKTWWHKINIIYLAHDSGCRQFGEVSDLSSAGWFFWSHLESVGRSSQGWLIQRASAGTNHLCSSGGVSPSSWLVQVSSCNSRRIPCRRGQAPKQRQFSGFCLHDFCLIGQKHITWSSLFKGWRNKLNLWLGGMAVTLQGGRYTEMGDIFPAIFANNLHSKCG